MLEQILQTDMGRVPDDVRLAKLTGTDPDGII